MLTHLNPLLFRVSIVKMGSDVLFIFKQACFTFFLYKKCVVAITGV